MYITTFYSFKGGVGRTLALVNVAVELAQTGRRVLIVDFDLEAPGIDTFDLPRSKRASPGLVEYVTAFTDQGESPDVNGYLYEVSGYSDKGGALWVMPSGIPDETYGRRLAAIDWNNLYGSQGGYLLFEDLTLQWEQALAPDYVLIDSRTGHSDIAGICTRQLPDSVVVLFFPNPQNLRGLSKVVTDIRAEAHSPRSKEIELHFVMANVPDLDDEDEILENSMRAFRRTLQYESVQTLHRYDSLALLNQAIFTRVRPKSRLAREYRRLTQSITERNPEDRSAILRFLRGLLTPDGESRLSMADVLRRLTEIGEKYSSDGELLLVLGRVRLRQGRLEEALALFDEAVRMGVSNSEVLLRRAQARQLLKDEAGAAQDIAQMLQLRGIPGAEMDLGIRILRRANPAALRSLPEVPAVRAATAERRLSIGVELSSSALEADAAERILATVTVDPEASQMIVERANHERALRLIALGRFDDALRVMKTNGERPLPNALDIGDAFNYAMAEWGSTGVVPMDMLQRVRGLDAMDGGDKSANYAQCLALTFAMLGMREEALTRLQQARQRVTMRAAGDFSCWRYLRTDGNTFLQDLDALGRLIAGDQIKPAFLSPSALPELKS